MAEAFQHFPGVFARRGGEFDPAQHAGDLFDTGRGIQLFDTGARSAARFGLADEELVVAAGGDLRQVGDAQHLMAFTQFTQQFADRFRHAPPTPLSTSSKISVGTRAARLAMTDNASEMRDSSPPEATLARGRGVVPAWPATRKFNLLVAVRGRCARRQRGLELAALHGQRLHGLRDLFAQVFRDLRRAVVSLAATASYCTWAAENWARRASMSPAACNAASSACSESRNSHRASGSTRNLRAVSNTRPQARLHLGQTLGVQVDAADVVVQVGYGFADRDAGGFQFVMHALQPGSCRSICWMRWLAAVMR